MTRATTPKLPTLDDLALVAPLPDDAVAIYFSGSIAAGWAHTASDVDVYVVTPEVADIPGAMLSPVECEPPTVGVLNVYSAGVRCDLEYWSEHQVDQVLAKFQAADARAQLTLTRDDIDFAYRLRICIPAVGGDWLAERHERLDASPIRSLLARRSFGIADGLLEDALGMLDAGDFHSAVLAVHAGFGHAVDGVLAAHGEFSPQAKWRARKLQRTAPAILPFEAYWRVETLRDLTADAPEAWVLSVVERCRDLMLETDVGA
jgi:hypothetical protein